MTFNDRPIHLLNYEHICKKEPHQEPSVTVPVWITQSSLDGLQALIRILEGMEKGGNGRISGSFELVSFYRTLQSSICNANNQARLDAEGEAEKRAAAEAIRAANDALQKELAAGLPIPEESGLPKPTRSPTVQSEK
jgi:hypothetical protein